MGDDGAKRCGGEAVSQALNDAGYDEWDESGENEVRHDADEENRESCQQYFLQADAFHAFADEQSSQQGPDDERARGQSRQSCADSERSGSMGDDDHHSDVHS